MQTKLWLIRHGETHWNAGSRIQGSTDIPLNPTGLRQAQAVAGWMQPQEIQAVYSSGLQRAQQTATPLAISKGLSVDIHVNLAERNFGEFQGLTPDEIYRRFPEKYTSWQSREPDFCPQDGESLTDFYSRVRDAIQVIIARHAGETVAVVTHGGVLDIVYRIANQLSVQLARNWSIGNAAIHQARAIGDQIEILRWGIQDHLEGQSVRDELGGIS